MLSSQRIFITAAILLLATPVLAGETLTLEMKAPPPGTKFSETGVLGISMKVNIKAGAKVIEQAFSSGTDKKKEVEVLASEGDIITKARVTYTAHKETQTQGAAPPNSVSKSFAGKTYILERTANPLTVRTSRG